MSCAILRAGIAYYAPESDAIVSTRGGNRFEMLGKDAIRMSGTCGKPTVLRALALFCSFSLSLYLECLKPNHIIYCP